MELHAIDGKRLVAKAHDLAFGRPRADLEHVRQALALDDQGVVTRGRERARDAGEDAAPVVLDRRRLAVHEARRADHLASEDLADALVAETYAEDRDPAREGFHRLHR